MGCYVTCSLSTSRNGMHHVLKAMGVEEDTEDIIHSAEKSGGSTPSAYEFMTVPHVRIHGDTYVATVAMSRTSSGALIEMREIVRQLPDGEYGIAYAFSWDYEPCFVALNSDYRPYRGGGAGTPECLYDLNERYMEAAIANAKISRIGWREEDMPKADFQRVAEAEALRCWVSLYCSGAV